MTKDNEGSYDTSNYLGHSPSGLVCFVLAAEYRMRVLIKEPVCNFLIKSKFLFSLLIFCIIIIWILYKRIYFVEINVIAVSYC